LWIAIDEPPPPVLVEDWAPKREREAAAELYAAYGDESYPTTAKKMYDCGVKSFVFEQGNYPKDGRTVARVSGLSAAQVNCILGLASKYVRVEFLDQKH